MLGKTSHLGLSRRVIAYYLMFGLAAVTWLVVGMGVVAKSVVESWAESDPNAWKTVFSAAEYAPAILLFPMLLVVIGAVMLRRTVRPVELYVFAAAVYFVICFAGSRLARHFEKAKVRT